MNTQSAKRGDRFEWRPGTVVTVTRVSRTSTWVDVYVRQVRENFGWTKRMFAGIPADWKRLDA